ncbi:CTP synthase [Patescibacteria group bacterium]|nr:MAG: CTP synthase [Patescibacteria group bacterium]
MTQKNDTKYIFITGGVVSGSGKGITAASIGAILKARGLRVNIQKMDPYFNFDAGTLNPAEHGEVFVTQDGAETDLDLGHYERFLDQQLTRQSSVMSGQVYAKVFADERDGAFLGKTVQVIPHITDEYQRRILEAGKGFDIMITEVGGTIGDYESLAVIDALRQFKRRVGAENVLYAHVVFLPYLEASKELKSKPAQNSVRDLREVGIQPDILAVRTDHPIKASIFEKLSQFCDVDKEAIVGLPTAKTVYEVPLRMEESGIGEYICKRLGVSCRKPDLSGWQSLVETIMSDMPEVRIGVVAKYLEHEDTYLSVVEALRAAAWAEGRKLVFDWIDAEKLTESTKPLTVVDGILVPGGFGQRGVEGKIVAAQYAREHGVPYLGICLGLQVAVIEFARHVAGLSGAHSTEFDKDSAHPVVHIMPEQIGVQLGGSMRLGDYDTSLEAGSLAEELYVSEHIVECHRHRYEVNNDYRDLIERKGLQISGTSYGGQLVEIVELPNHPYYIASQFHPEFLSRPGRPHPLFTGLIRASIGALPPKHEQVTIDKNTKRSKTNNS